jgi:D-sedoheptulose 7-phosphate isomerase
VSVDGAPQVPPDDSELVRAAALQATSCFEAFTKNDDGLDQIVEAGRLLATGLAQGGKVLTCGNGGSMSDAIHLAEELSGRFRADRRPLAAVALSDPGYLTCVSNDFGYDQVFARGVEALGRPEDVLVAFTTSGTSPNIVAAVSAARRLGLSSIVVTGQAGTPAGGEATRSIVTPGGRWADRVQELHTFVVHVLIELVEHSLGLDGVSPVGSAGG